MLTPEQIAKALKHLETLAKRKTKSDKEEFFAVDWAGSNVDEAFDMGVDEGRIFCAREVLELLGLPKPD